MVGEVEEGAGRAEASGEPELHGSGAACAGEGLVFAGGADGFAGGALEAVVVLAVWAWWAAPAEEVDHAAAALACVG